MVGVYVYMCSLCCVSGMGVVCVGVLVVYVCGGVYVWCVFMGVCVCVCVCVFCGVGVLVVRVLYVCGSMVCVSVWAVCGCMDGVCVCVCVGFVVVWVYGLCR